MSDLLKYPPQMREVGKDKRRIKSPAPGRIQPHVLLNTRRVLYHCATNNENDEFSQFSKFFLNVSDDSMSTVSTLFPSGQFAHRDLGHYSFVESENETPIKNPIYQRL